MRLVVLEDRQYMGFKMFRNVGFFVCFSILFLVASTIHAQWEQIAIQSIPRNLLKDNHLVALEWPDSSTGFLFTKYGGFYYKTTDGGDSWKLDSIPNAPQRPNFVFSSCDFKTDKLGFAVYKYNSRDTLLYITEDGGGSWSEVHLAAEMATPTMGYGFVGRLRMGNDLNLYYMFGRTSEDYRKSIVEVDISRNLGSSWQRLSMDTLDAAEMTLPHDFIVVDSLTMLYFVTIDEAGSAWWSYVKYTTDGGKSWQILTEPNHPLAKSNLNHVIIDRVETLNDTTFSIRCEFEAGPIQYLRIVSCDLQNLLKPSGWSYVLIGNDTEVRDLALIRGSKYMHLATYDHGKFMHSVLAEREGPPFQQNSVEYPNNFREWVFNVTENGVVWVAGTNVFNSHAELYRLGERLVSIKNRSDVPYRSDVEFDIFPSPCTTDSWPPRAVISSDKSLGNCALYIYDSSGRLIMRSEFLYDAPGSKHIIPLTGSLSAKQGILEPGQYFALLLSRFSTAVKQFVVVK
ncbi:MAG: hypothetical protein WBQ23_03185 [Bacteroidota bacterium]